MSPVHSGVIPYWKTNLYHDIPYVKNTFLRVIPNLSPLSVTIKISCNLRPQLCAARSVHHQEISTLQAERSLIRHGVTSHIAHVSLSGV